MPRITIPKQVGSYLAQVWTKYSTYIRTTYNFDFSKPLTSLGLAFP